LLAAARVIAETREEMVTQWLDRLGDRVAAAPTIPRPTVEREFRLIIDVLAEMVGPLRREVRAVWQDVCRHYGHTASARGLAAGEVVEELLQLRDLLTRQLAPIVAAMRARQGMAIMLRLNRVLDHGVAVAVVGYTDALVAALLGQDGLPPSAAEHDATELGRQLDALEAALAAISRH
jgi:Glu-tRNA(Gln) amidotransferase subunit E-like FAD-binding protein